MKPQPNQKILKFHRVRIGRWTITLAAFVDHYYTIMVFVVGAFNRKTLRNGDLQYFEANTNGLGRRNLLRHEREFKAVVAKESPLHGPCQLNPYGYQIPLDGQPEPADRYTEYSH